jgi:hypothetical protein
MLLQPQGRGNFSKVHFFDFQITNQVIAFVPNQIRFAPRPNKTFFDTKGSDWLWWVLLGHLWTPGQLQLYQNFRFSCSALSSGNGITQMLSANGYLTSPG